MNISEAHCNSRVSRLRCDNGGEYTGNDFKNFCKSKGIVIEFIPAYNPELNGVSERLNRTLQDKMRSMLIDSQMTDEFWGDAIMVATYLTNRSPTEVLNGKTPYEKWFHRKPDLSHLRIFGSKAYDSVPKQKRESKTSARAKELLMVGYTEGSGYRLFNPETRKVSYGRSIRFDESMVSEVNVVNNSELPATDESKASCDQKSDNVFKNNIPIKTNVNSVNSMPVQNPEVNSETPGMQIPILNSNSNNDVILTPRRPIPQTTPDAPIAQRRTIRNRKPPKWMLSGDYDLSTHLAFMAGSSVNDTPMHYNDVSNFEDEAEWRKAIDSELNSLMKNETWIVVPSPKNVKLISSRWIFKKKPDADGNLTVYKARLVAKGFMQREGLDYFDTYAPVARLPTIRLLLSIGIKFNLYIDHMDVCTAFLNGDLSEEVYLKPPHGLEIDEHHVLKLQKSLYGLKQSPKCWNDKFHQCMIKFGFQRSSADPCLYMYFKGESFMYLVLYVDDMLILSNNQSQLLNLKRSLTNEFEMKDLGEVSNFMGLRIKIDRQKQELSIDQSNYCLSILERFEMMDCNPRLIPMESHLKLSRSNDVNYD